MEFQWNPIAVWSKHMAVFDVSRGRRFTRQHHWQRRYYLLRMFGQGRSRIDRRDSRIVAWFERQRDIFGEA